ncbi:MAG TPA: glycosyltransferase family 4 protein [Ktedonobacterales bacterium]|nr:glycosyltransferase family 4 protein [Ktedonobacterales bacterium]
MAQLRVGAITYDYYPFDIRVRRMAEAAADAGYEMRVICLRDKGESPREIRNGVIADRVPFSRGFGRPLPLTLLSWLWFMVLAGAVVTWQHLRKPYDVIIAHNMPDFLVFAAIVPRILGAKVILDVQDVSPELMAAKSHGRLKGVLFRLSAVQERISAAFSNHVITVGWPFEEQLKSRGVPAHKLSLVLNSADPRLFPASRRCPPPSWAPGFDGPFIIMYYGTIAERNGLDTAVRALALALPRAPRLRLDIMGRGEHLPAVMRLAEELGVRDHVRFKDTCPSENIVDFVVHGDAGIIPYRVDGFAELVLPTKAYEQAWMHRPIVASDTVAIRSMFRPGSVLLCDPESPEAFADALVNLYKHPELQRTLVDCAAEDYTPYRWEQVRAQYQELLASLRRRHAQHVPATTSR